MKGWNILIHTSTQCGQKKKHHNYCRLSSHAKVARCIASYYGPRLCLWFNAYRMKVLDVECQLLQNAVDYQKHSAIIKEWEVKRETMGVSAGASVSSPLFILPTSHPLSGEVWQNQL